MATKKKGGNPTSSTSRMKFRPSNDQNRSETRGTKPLPEPSSVQKIMVMMVVHVCRKALFVDTGVKVGIYGGLLFVLSLLADVMPMPRTYLARTDNVFNVYFVKLGWGWTLLVTLPFIVLTSYTYCCGQREKVTKHLLRLVVATGMWYVWTSLFQYIEVHHGRCTARKGELYETKSSCIGAGHNWRSLDLSGHAFILIYSTLVIIEEAKAIIGWEGIGDLIRNEEYSRSSPESDVENSPLRYLTINEFFHLKDSYTKFTPFVRGLFIAMTLLTVLWDVMLVGTILYHHIMIEKFVSGAIAILMWFFTYRFWYALPNAVPGLPGEGGLFKYKDSRGATKDASIKKRSSMCNHNPRAAPGQPPKFMGMPLYTKPDNSGQDKDDKQSSLLPDSDVANSKYGPRKDFFDVNKP